MKSKEFVRYLIHPPSSTRITLLVSWRVESASHRLSIPSLKAWGFPAIPVNSIHFYPDSENMQIRAFLIGLTSMAIATFSIIPSSAAQSLIGQSTKLAQAEDPERERKLEEQRAAERALKEGERLRRDIRENGFRDGTLERRTTEQIIKIRESGSNPQQVREAQAEIDRLRQDNNRSRYYQYYPYYGDFRYPYTTAPIIPSDSPYPYPSSPSTPSDPRTSESQPMNRTSSQDRSTSNTGKFSISAGLKDGSINPALGARWHNFGVEVGAIFNADSLPGSLNDFALPSNFLSNDLGVKKISAQAGIDLLGYFDVNPTVSVYGGVGIYFQNRSRIAQSQATNELYKQTDETNVTGAISAGADYNVSDAVSVGIGYHSLRGITGKIGISF